MNSDSDPIAEAGRWLDTTLAGAPLPSLLLVLGLGHGHLLDFLDTHAPRTRVLAVEPDSSVARVFHARRDWSGWLDSGRLIYLVDPDYRGADEAWRIFPETSEAHKFLVHPTVDGQAPGSLRAARVLKKILFGARANAGARRRFAPGYLVNTIRNLPAIAAGGDVRSLTNVFRGVPAVLAGAGPSLDGALDHLRRTAGDALVISTDTALRPLLGAGLVPLLVVGLDPGVANARHFKFLPDSTETWLVGEAALDPIAASAFDGRAFWFRVATHHPWPWFEELGIDVGKLDVWGSVLTAAFQVAVLAGCDPIVLVGADLAFTDDRPYCRGTTYEFDWARSTPLGHDLEWAWREQIERQERLQVLDVRGNQVTTTRELVSVRDWIVARAARSGRRVINATAGGILHGDPVQQSPSLLQILSEPRTFSRPGAIARGSSPQVTPVDLIRHLQVARRAIGDGATPPPAVAPWADFCGEGYDPIAITAALDAATGALEAGGRQLSSDSSQATFSALVTGSIPGQILSRLPEALARLRFALSGDAVLPVLPPVDEESQQRPDADELLIHAFDLLGAIHEIAIQAEDLATPIGLPWVDGRPISVACAWPESTTWAAQVFEGLLGQAWATPLPKPLHSTHVSDGVGEFFLPPAVRTNRSPIRDVASPGATGRPNTIEACALLAIEWMMCAATVAQVRAGELDRFIDMMRRLAREILAADRSPVGDSGTAIVIGLNNGERSSLLKVAIDGTARARITGMVQRSGERPVELKRLETPGGLVVTIGVRPTAQDLQEPLSMSSGSNNRLPPRVRPRVLTDEGMPRSIVSYGTEQGAIVAPFLGANHGAASLLVGEDGSAVPHHSWPRPVVYELPLGSAGVVAWNHSTPDLDQTTGSVMYRLKADDPITIEKLPFRPLAGTWWEGRLYWVAWPSGIGSWAPGEAPTFFLPELSLWGIRGDETGLWLDPAAVLADGSRPIPPVHRGWKWHPDHGLEPVPLGPYGPESCRSTTEGWTAAAHHEADVIRLEGVNGATMMMTCNRPFRVAWTGRTLLVGTIDGELLLFENLLDLLQMT